MTTVAVLNTRQTLFRARTNEYPRTLLLIGVLALLAPILHVSSNDSGDDMSPLPFLGSGNSSWLENGYWLAAVAVAALFSVLQYRKHEIRLRGMAFTMAVALAVYLFVAVMPGAVWHWRYLGLIGLAAVVWALVIAERSVWLGIVATGFTAVAVISGTTDNTFYRDLGLFTDYSTSGLREVLLPALVALIGGAVGLLPQKPVGDEGALVLLNDLTRLSRPADARRYALPLLVFGVLILVAVPLYRPFTPDLSRRFDPGWHPELVYGFGGTGGSFVKPWLIDLYWAGVLVVGIGFAMGWYRVRAARQGVKLRTRGLLVAAGAVLLGIIVGVPVVYSLLGGYLESAGLDPYLHAWLLALSTAAAAAVLIFSAETHRAAGLVVGWLLASFAAAMLAMYLNYWVLLVIAAVLLAMAWVERSRWLGVVTALFTTAVVLIAVTHHAVFSVIGWSTEGQPEYPQLNVLQDLLLPSAVLLIGGLAGLVQTARSRNV